jgi:hypothetical protein
MKTACEIPLKVGSHPRPCRASPYAPRMVADAPGDGNQTEYPSPDCLLPGGIFVELEDRPPAAGLAT